MFIISAEWMKKCYLPGTWYMLLVVVFEIKCCLQMGIMKRKDSLVQCSYHIGPKHPPTHIKSLPGMTTPCLPSETHRRLGRQLWINIIEPQPCIRHCPKRFRRINSGKYMNSLWGEHCYYLHFTENTELNTVNAWSRSDSEPARQTGLASRNL